MKNHHRFYRGGGAIVALAAAIIGVSPAQGQTPQALSLNEAITIAIENNRDLKMARLELENADAQVDEALGNAYPTLDLNTRYTRNIKRPVFFFPGEDGIVRPIEIGSKNALTADLTLQQILFNSAVFTGVGTSKIYAQISRQQLRTQTADVVLNVKQAYYAALMAKEVLQVNEALQANAQANYNNTKVLYDAGLRAEFDAIRAEVAVANQQPLVVQARNNYQAALDGLKLLLGYDNITQVELELTGSFVRPASSGGTEPTLEQGVETILEKNPQLETLRLATDVNKELIAINRSEYLPTIALFGTYKYEAQADAFSDFDFQPTAYAGLNLSLNLYNGGKTEAKVGQAQIAYDKSRYQVAQVAALLKTQLEATLRNIDYARQRIGAGQRTIEQAERAYKIATTAYKAGTGTQLEINDADLALAQAKLNQLNAVYDYNVGVAQLENLMGEHVVLKGDNAEYQP
ncbi:MAG: TolC family protein [Ignavibacteriae bacterium]|nr:TolC family protein [Ignavibacteriota bacterium]MCB9216605.1 TolC family protein [Ignavibacteria bacterium]